MNFNVYSSLIVAGIFSMFLGVAFNWGLWQIYLCLVILWLVSYAIAEAQTEEENNKKAIAEAAKLYLERNK